MVDVYYLARSVLEAFREGMRQDAGVMVLMQKSEFFRHEKVFSGRSAGFVEC